MTPDIDEVLRYLGVQGSPPQELRLQAEKMAAHLTASLQPQYVYRVFPLERAGEAFRLTGTDVVLTGHSVQMMLSQCSQAVLLACTLGPVFDAMLRAEQTRDISKAVILDACGSALVEAGCNEAEREIAARLPGRYLTDRFSPGYGDLPLTLQPALCAALNTEKRVGLHVTASLLMNPVKSVTAVIGVAEEPQMARIRGCAYCDMKERCALRRGGKNCGI